MRSARVRGESPAATQIHVNPGNTKTARCDMFGLTVQYQDLAVRTLVAGTFTRTLPQSCAQRCAQDFRESLARRQACSQTLRNIWRQLFPKASRQTLREHGLSSGLTLCGKLGAKLGRCWPCFFFGACLPPGRWGLASFMAGCFWPPPSENRFRLPWCLCFLRLFLAALFVLLALALFWFCAPVFDMLVLLGLAPWGAWLSVNWSVCGWCLAGLDKI